MTLPHALTRTGTSVSSHVGPGGQPRHTVWATIEINVNQRLVVQLAHGDGERRPLSVEWQRRSSPRQSWDSKRIERQFIGRAALNTSDFVVTR